jgi:hypothetical protein
MTKCCIMVDLYETLELNVQKKLLEFFIPLYTIISSESII